MKPIEQSLGIEMLDPEDDVTISRHPPPVRWIHWFNAAMILTLFVLGGMQIAELQSIRQLNMPDVRAWHVYTGFAWVLGLSLLILFWSNKSYKGHDSIMSDKLIIRQQLFLWVSVGFMSLMFLTGSSLYALTNQEAPAIKTILLVFHGLCALCYFPMLLFHLYLAIVNKHTRQSLSTMLRDVRLAYVIHNTVEGLHCLMSDAKRILCLRGEVLHLSILSIDIKVSKGLWQETFSIHQILCVELFHPELRHPVLLPVELAHCQETPQYYHLSFSYPIPHQTSAWILLRRAIFFRKLFLEQRLNPRFSAHIPVMLVANDMKCAAEFIDISLGGIGVTSSARLSKQQWVWIQIEIPMLGQHLHLGGQIILTHKLERALYAYGIHFHDLSSNEREILSKLINLIKLDSFVHPPETGMNQNLTSSS